MILVKHREELSGTFAQTYVDTSYTDLGQGTFEYTGTPFDVAINGDVYFNIAGYNGENMLTRNGQWELDAEGYLCLSNSGRILGENGEKMSKSRGNVVNPDEIVDTYGADTMRLYEMFIGDFEKAAPWSPKSIKGCRRFIERYWNLQSILIDGEAIRPEMEPSFHKAIKKVSYDIENLKFNTCLLYTSPSPRDRG
mgnify:CR=1 FL=1